MISAPLVFARNDVIAMPDNNADVSSHRNNSQYIRYTFLKSDSPARVLKRLGLFPILANGGSLHHFYNLNPKLTQLSDIPPGTVVLLPITEVPTVPYDSEDDWFVQDNFLYFESPLPPNYRKKTALKNNIDEAPNPENKIGSSYPEPEPVSEQELEKTTASFLSESTPMYSHNPENRITVSPTPVAPTYAKESETVNRATLGTPVIKLRVRRGTKLFEKLEAMGLASYVDHNTEIEIPLELFQENVNSKRSTKKKRRRVSRKKRKRKRKPASSTKINKSRIKSRRLKSNRAKWQAEVSSLMGSRLYSIQDSSGQTGKLGTDPTIGARVSLGYEKSWLNLTFTGSFELESFSPDSSTTIEQKSKNRTSFHLSQLFKSGRWDYTVGLGYVASPALTSSGNLVEVDYINSPSLQVVMGPNYWLSSEISIKPFFLGEYFFGGSSDNFKINSGYEADLGAITGYQFSDSFTFTSRGYIMYRADEADFYTQSQLGVHFLIGGQWNW